jgi:hypothetical protein
LEPNNSYALTQQSRKGSTKVLLVLPFGSEATNADPFLWLSPTAISLLKTLVGTLFVSAFLNY